MTKTESILEQFSVPRIQARRYWLVRTDGGTHYEDFTVNNYISLGWDFISKEIFSVKTEDEIKGLILAREKIDPTVDEDEPTREVASRVTSIYNKLKRFITEIRIGDVVIIPSQNTSQVSIGIVESEVFEDAKYVDNYLKENPATELILCPYKKRRTVNWVKTIKKEKIDIYLVKAFASHHALSEVSEYADFINRELYSIYQSNGMVHTIIRAGHPNGVSFQELKDLLDILEDTFKESSKISGIKYDASELQLKLNIHSPGLIEIVGSILGSGLLIPIGMFAWNHIKNGGTVKFNLKVGSLLDLSTESQSQGIEGRRNEKLSLENDYNIQVLKLEQEQKLKQLSQSLDINIPDVKTPDDTLTIEKDDFDGDK